MDQMGMQMVPGNPFMSMNNGMGMNNFGRPALGFANGSATTAKARGAEIVNAVQALVEDCEKLSGDSAGGANAQKEAIAKLEEKVSNLQVLFCSPENVYYFMETDKCMMVGSKR
jgi:hypothetical protein